MATLKQTHVSLLAIELCNKGAHMLESGRYDEAAILLMDAVRQFRDGAKELLVNLKDTPLVQSERKTLDHHKRWRKTVENYIHITPIFLPDDISSPVGPTAIQFAIIFNFAIARHLRAMALEQPKRDQQLRTTFKVYNWALTIERSIKSEETSPFGVVPCLGLINNCAQIHRTLQQNDKAEKMFRILLSSLMLLKERGEEVKTEELAGFFSATSHLILKSTGVARAA
jgi:hypothetical protein